MKIELTQNEEILDQCTELMFQSEPWITLAFDEEKCRQAVRGDYKEVYVASVDGEFAGFVVILLYGVLRGYIQTICIKPQYRNRGVGTALLKYSEERILKMSPNVFICVSSFNPKAQSLYYKLGFGKIGELKDHLVAGHDELILRKSKGPIFEFKK